MPFAGNVRFLRFLTDLESVHPVQEEHAHEQMPTYEYRCPKGHEFEVVQKMSDEPGAECPRCGADAERLISRGGGLLFKGDGFYITDYRSKEYKKSAEADSKPEKPKPEKSKPEKPSKSGAESTASSGPSSSSSSPGDSE